MNKNNNNFNSIFLLTETNFLLDIIFEQSQECDRLFLLTREHAIPVVIPEYSFAEAEGNIAKTLQLRLTGLDTAISILKQSARSAYHDVAALIGQLRQFKAHSEAEERPFLHDRLTKLEENVSVIPFTADIVVRAELRDLRQLAPFKPSDRRIYESLLYFIATNHTPDTSTIFLTRDQADFDFPYIREELIALGVELFFSAGECIRRIREILHLDSC